MGESDLTTLTLEQSVSFGKFENDSLSWEKWSSFSPNKYLDEVEKFSTPGSVKEKKAYFEAHYKKIAARKAELEQDNLVQCAPARSELKDESHIDDTNENISEFDVCEAEKSSVEAEQIAQQKAYFEELYRKIGDRMDEQVEQDTQVQYAYPILDELKHTNDTDNMLSCDYELNPFSVESPHGEVDQIAHKKAYFEAQFKNIDGSRTERLDQDKSSSSGYVKFDELQNKNLTEGPCASDCTLNVCVGKEVTKQVEQEEVVDIEVEDTIVNGGGEKLEISAGECCTLIEEAKEDLNISQPVHTGSSDKEMTLVITEEPSCLVKPLDPLKFDKKVDNLAKTAPIKEAKNLKVKERNIASKKASAEKEKPLTGTKKKVVPSAAKSSLISSSRSPKWAPSSHLMAGSKAQPLTGTKKIFVSSAAKSSPISTPRPSKVSLPSPVMSASKLSSKKLNAKNLPSNKNTTLVGVNKRAGPTSMHMSLNLGSAGSPSLSVGPASARKSLIMETMADKDIIKRVFSAFKNNFQELRSSHDEKSIKASDVLDPEFTISPRKENEGSRKAADKRNEEHKRGKSFSSSLASKSDDRAEKQKDFPKKLGQKTIPREVAKVQIPTKSEAKNPAVATLKKNSEAPKISHSKG